MAFTLRDSSPWPPHRHPVWNFECSFPKWFPSSWNRCGAFPSEDGSLTNYTKYLPFNIGNGTISNWIIGYRVERLVIFFLESVLCKYATVTEKKKTRRTCLLHSLNCHTPSAYLLPPTEHRAEQKCNREYLLLLEMGWANNIHCFTFPAAPATILPTRSPNNIRIVGGGAVVVTDGRGIENRIPNDDDDDDVFRNWNVWISGFCVSQDLCVFADFANLRKGSG